MENQEKSLERTTLRRSLDILALGYTELPETPSLGEVLLPFLFAAAETCWVDAIFIGLAGLDFFQSRAPLMPLWAPFVLIVGTQWILSRAERRSASAPAPDNASTKAGSEGQQAEHTRKALPGSRPLILFASLTTLFVIWLTMYAQTAFFLDPRWLLALLNDILFLNVNAYHVFTIIALSLYFCWRGMRLLYHEYEPGHIFTTLRVGMIIIVLVILVRAGQASAGVTFNDDALLLLLVPIFLFLSLSAHALARITFLRHTHPLSSESNIDVHERAVLAVIGTIGLALLLIAWLVDTIANPALLIGIQQTFSFLGQVYDWLVLILASLIVALVTPLFLLISWIFSLLPHPAPSHRQIGLPSRRQPPVLHPAAASPVIVLILKVLLPILFFVLVVIVARWILRYRRRVRLVSRPKDAELHESIWSWALFWSQFKAWLRMLFRRFARHGDGHEAAKASMEEMPLEPAARSIREIYKALLRRAAARGYPRKKEETPYEFRQRLDERLPVSEPELTTVTEAYTATRYGEVVPDEAEVAEVRQAWTALEQKWH